MPSPPAFEQVLREHGAAPLRRGQVTTVQINVGKVCNQACHHCHVDAGPKRTESMTEAAARRVIDLIARTPSIETVDITGGAPEMNPHFRWLVTESRRRHLHVIDRCNLTILLEPAQRDLAEFLARSGVHLIASLPCYTQANVDRQRGRGVFEKSIIALQKLNALGYGAGSDLQLDLVYNPIGPALPPASTVLESDYKTRLRDDHGIVFDKLLTITNMPISRFSEQLVRLGKAESYAQLLRSSFNANTIAGLMCRSLVSIGWDGALYDCDFNQMLEMRVPARTSIWTIDSFEAFASERIATDSHCFGCTAGSGSSCSGALIP